jgi:hypothetical protein
LNVPTLPQYLQASVDLCVENSCERLSDLSEMSSSDGISDGIVEGISDGFDISRVSIMSELSTCQKCRKCRLVRNVGMSDLYDLSIM